MQNLSLNYFLFISLAFSLISCTSEKVEYFKLSLIVTQDLGFAEGEPLNGGLRSIFNYYTEPDCPGKVFVPEISITRADFNPEKVETFFVPISWLNNWRKSINLLPAVNLKEDYDEQIPKLKTPKILTEKSNTVADINLEAKQYRSAKLVAPDDRLTSNLLNLRREFGKRLCSNLATSFAIIFQESLDDKIKRLNKDIASKLSQPGRNDLVSKKMKQYVLRAKEERDPFSLYDLIQTAALLGEEHPIAFELLDNAARFAIRKGKAVELYQRINNDIEKDLLKEDKEKRIIWKLSQGHEHWFSIMRALTKNDERFLDRRPPEKVESKDDAQEIGRESVQ